MAGYKAQRSQFVDLGMAYDARGSGHGKERITGKVDPMVEYAGSDSLLKETDYDIYPDLQMFPTLAGYV